MINVKNEIGTDPTMVDVIETLDVPEVKKVETKRSEPKKESNDKKPQKKGGFIKNLLFIVLVLALMGGVAFGVYYYLKLAREKNNNVNVTPAFNINKMEIIEGESIPESLNEYGDFSKIDVSGCKLDTSEVKANVPGNYTYYVICNGSKYSESFVVKNKDGSEVIVNPTVTKRLNVTTYFNYTIKGEQLNIERLISSDDNLTFTFADKEKYKEDMYNIGIQKVEIKATDAENNENTYYAYIYVINEEPKMKFKCVSPDSSLVDEIIFNKSKENMNNSVRMYEYTFDDTEYSNMIETVIDGNIKINDNEGYAILDYTNKKITILKDLTNETLNNEFNGTFPSSYSDVSNYYRNSLKYTCSFN